MPENNKFKILVVEDEADFADILKTKLESEGYNVTLAENGEVGVRKAKEILPSLILMDVKMPVMNGIEAFNKLKEDPATKDIKLSFLTSYGEPVKDATWLDEKFAREIGAQDYINKTDGPAKIAQSVRRLLEE